MKKVIASAIMAAMCCGTMASAADDCGVSYYDSYGTTGLAPTIAAGVIAAAAVVAVLVNSSSQGSIHTHYHCNQGCGD